jgi:HEAT repeat protein
MDVLLADPAEEVRCAAVYAIARVCDRGDARSLSALLAMTEDMSAMVRRAAIDAITKARPRPAPPRSARGPRAPAP